MFNTKKIKDPDILLAKVLTAFLVTVFIAMTLIVLRCDIAENKQKKCNTFCNKYIQQNQYCIENTKKIEN